MVTKKYDQIINNSKIMIILTNSTEQKLTGPKLVKTLPALYGTQQFITTFTRAHHLSLSSARLS
jgi:hypothetical protein